MIFERVQWLCLPAAASILLLAVTTHLTQDVAAIPFLWILPLSVYLLTLIISFDSPRFYFRPVFLPLFLGALAFMLLRLSSLRGSLQISWGIAAFSLSLFVCCMVCHGELVRLKPHPRYLTSFYVMVSLGGAIGGIFVGLVAPNYFRAYYEFPIGMAFTALVVFTVTARDLLRAEGVWQKTAAVVLLVIIGAYLWYVRAVMREMVSGYQLVARNFYGLLRVYDTGDPRIDEDAARRLVHGIINHGEQMLRPEYSHEPGTYFCPESGSAGR